MTPRRGLGWGLAALVLALAVPSPAGAAGAAHEPRWWGAGAGDASVPYPYIAEPVDSWVYDVLDREIALGNVSGLAFESRPLPRSLIAARVAEALGAGRHSVGLERLAREFAWEGRMMGLDLGFEDTRPWITLGPPESMAKFNGLVTLGGAFEKNVAPSIDRRSVVGFRGNYWHAPGLSLNGEYLVTGLAHAREFGNTVGGGSDIQFTTPRFTFDWHARFWEVWGGRDGNRWGPGRSGGLLLGGGAPPFGQFGYKVNLGGFVTASAVHGWLSQAEGRYAAFHRVEMNLGRFRLGVGEGVRYHGTSPEPLYLLNLVPYAAVERLLTQGGTEGANRDSLFRSNYIADADLSWRVRPGTAIYGEIAVDDVKTSEPGPTRLAYQAGVLHTVNGSRELTLQAEYTRVYDYTYSVFYGQNFYHAGAPLGYPLGPDVADLEAWADLDWNLDWTFTLHGFHRRVGEGNDGRPWCPASQETDNPYPVDCATFDPGASGRAFRGVVERRTGLEAGARYAPRDNLRLSVSAGAVRVAGARHVAGRDETRPLATVEAAWRW